MSTETTLDPVFSANRACRTVPTNVFFPEPTDEVTLSRARGVCSSCLVLGFR